MDIILLGRMLSAPEHISTILGFSWVGLSHSLSKFSHRDWYNKRVIFWMLCMMLPNVILIKITFDFPFRKLIQKLLLFGHIQRQTLD